MNASNIECSIKKRLNILWRFRYYRIFFLIFLGLGIVLFLFRFGDSQWNKYIYLFQAHISPKYKYGFIEPAREYSGKWKHWSPSGAKVEIDYKDGLWNGKYIVWDSNDRKMSEINFKNGKHNGRDIHWNKDGSLKYIDYYEDGRKVYFKVLPKDLWDPTTGERLTRAEMSGILKELTPEEKANITVDINAEFIQIRDKELENTSASVLIKVIINNNTTYYIPSLNAKTLGYLVILYTNDKGQHMVQADDAVLKNEEATISPGEHNSYSWIAHFSRESSTSGIFKIRWEYYDISSNTLQIDLVDKTIEEM